MNRLGAFILVCAAAILFTIVAYTKLADDDRLGNLQPGRHRQVLVSRKKEWGFSIRFPSGNLSLADVRNFGMKETSVDLIPVQTKAEVSTSESFSDFSSSEEEESITVSNETAKGSAYNKTQMRVKENRQNDEKPVVIIVLARMRTGSSLVGEIFNQNPSLFYIFEPLHFIEHFIRKHREAEARRQVMSVNFLRSLSSCKIPQEFVESLSHWGLGKFKSSGVQLICRMTKGCREASHSLIEDRCKSFRGRVGMKTIRADLAMLESLVNKDHYNVKIIHLLRDPRGTANSRKSYYANARKSFYAAHPQLSSHITDGNFTLKSLGLLEENPAFRMNTIVKYCRWMSETITLAQSKPAWLEDRYMFVRYEDLALDSVRVSESIYDFVGLTMPDNVREWVYNSTRETNSRSNSAVFGTQKDSKQVMQSWRHSLSYQEVKGVQEICGRAMDLAGYRKVLSPDQLENDDFHTFEPVADL